LSVEDDKIRVTPVSPVAPVALESAARTGVGCLRAWAIVATLGLIFAVFLIFVLLVAQGTQNATVLHETTLEGEGENKVALITVEGIIVDKEAGGLFGATGEGLVKRIKDQLEKAKKDEHVKAVLLDVNSPGGTVSASDQIYYHLRKFADEAKKPLVVHQGALAASGGYYISAAGDRIFCEHSTITGSIGVILGGLNLHEFLKDLGIKDVTITSGPNKDLLSSTSPVREEHRKILQRTVDDFYERFCPVVAEGMARRTQRTVADVLPAVKKLADGRIYTPAQAKELKLVDQIGYLDDAFNAAKEMAKIQTAKLVRYKKDPTLLDVLGGNAQARGAITIDAAAIQELTTPRLLALWRG
jgi:protease-4